MKRSLINQAIRAASACFEVNGWTLPPNPRWDVTDFGLDEFTRYGLVLVNLSEELEYCEKLMYAAKGQITPAHAHTKKKEDIVSRKGILAVQVWRGHPSEVTAGEMVAIKVNGIEHQVRSGDIIRLYSGERITLEPGVYHTFYPETDECIIGQVSTANDDLHDNFFVNPAIRRFTQVDEDEPALVKLVSDI